ncbi:hypothetical protein TNCV_1195811 [Trichonephila clavipes]|uniref:Uncharacterized protein n=1 Tax=Trichonephila clavipes TaxID=2585209 RepID=A0A8X6S8A3_TRICX|nr:hypothetical protein TNCV_1195811 [Trichonephila clavipes]
MSVIAHQTEKEWISVNKKSRQRMSQTQAEAQQSNMQPELRMHIGEHIIRVLQHQKDFMRIKLYHQKVLLLKKDMLTIHDRTSKLKKRAMKLQQQKQKEALQKELQRDREIERDKQLAPKIVTKSTQGKLA